MSRHLHVYFFIQLKLVPDTEKGIRALSPRACHLGEWLKAGGQTLLFYLFSNTITRGGPTAGTPMPAVVESPQRKYPSRGVVTAGNARPSLFLGASEQNRNPQGKKKRANSKKKRNIPYNLGYPWQRLSPCGDGKAVVSSVSPEKARVRKRCPDLEQLDTSRM